MIAITQKISSVADCTGVETRGRNAARVVSRWGQVLGFVDRDCYDETWRAYAPDGTYRREFWEKAEAVEFLAF